MPEGVQVAITSLDLSGPGFVAAQAKVQAFQQTASYSMREAQASARLFSDELNLGVNRHLTTLLAQSSLLGPALEMALPVAAAVGFYEVVSKIGTALGKWYFNIEGLKQMQEVMDSATKRYVAFHDATMRIQKEGADVGISAQQKWATELDVATEKVTQQKKALTDLSNTIYFLKNGMRDNWNVDQTTGEVFSEGDSLGGNTDADLPALQARQLENTQALSQSKAEQTRAQAELTKAQRDGTAEYAKAVETATEKAKKHREELEKSLVTIEKMVAAIPLVNPGGYRKGVYSPSQGDQMNSLSKQFNQVSDYGLHGTDPSDANAQKHIQDLKDQQGWYDATRTMAEKYDAAMKQLNATFEDSGKTSDVYLRAQKQINDTLDESTIKANQAAAAQAQAWKHLGSQIEDTMLNAAFMKESWSKAITSIMEDIAKLILKMYVLDAISKKLGQDGSGGSGGGGGFLSSLLGAFMGAIGGGGGSGGGSGLQGGEGDIGAFASGGYANAGMSYLVGEKGPELFTPGSSGTVTANGKFGGVTHVHNYDLRGADAGAEQRLLRLFPIVEERAVNRAVNTVQERQLRR